MRYTYRRWPHFLFPDRVFDLDETGMSITEGARLTRIPYSAMDGAIFRSFSNGWSRYRAEAYHAITIRHDGRSEELKFEPSQAATSAAFFDEIKKHVGEKAEDMRGIKAFIPVFEDEALTIKVLAAIFAGLLAVSAVLYALGAYDLAGPAAGYAIALLFLSPIAFIVVFGLVRLARFLRRLR